MDGAVAATRDKLKQWIADVDAANDRETLEVEDKQAKKCPGCMLTAEESCRNAWDRVITGLLVLVIAILVDRHCRAKKKKHDAFHKHDEIGDAT